MFVLVGYSWCPHYTRVRDTLVSWSAPFRDIVVDERGPKGRQQFAQCLADVVDGQTVTGLPVRHTSPQLFVEEPHALCCLGGESDIVQTRARFKTFQRR